MFNEIRGHKRLSLLICYFTAISVVQNLRFYWHFADLDTSLL